MQGDQIQDPETSREEGGGGIHYEDVNLKVDPLPLVQTETEATKSSASSAKGKSTDPKKVKFSPAIIKFPCLTIGRALSELTDYEGFVFNQEEINALSEAWAELGAEVSPVANAILLTLGLAGGKLLGYAVHRKLSKRDQAPGQEDEVSHQAPDDNDPYDGDRE